MLIRFVVSNFLSFDQEQEFNMIAGNLKTHKSHVYHLPKLDVLKAAAIYGANGAGKSNMVKAIDVFISLIENGKLDGSINDLKFKLDPKNAELPITFEMEFFFEQKTYAYGVSLNYMTVVEEWLYETGINKPDKLVFERKSPSKGTKRTVLTVADKYKKTEKQRLLVELMEENLLKPEELLISKNDNLKYKEIKSLLTWAGDVVVIFPGSKYTHLTREMVMSEYFRDFANELMCSFDTGVQELEIVSSDLSKYSGENDDSFQEEMRERLDEGYVVSMKDRNDHVVVALKEDDQYLVKKVVARHHDAQGRNVQFELEQESDGTRRLLDFMPALSNLLIFQSVVIIDEIDQSLHPVLLKALLTKIMHDDRIHGQFVFTTHESNLLDLDLFRQDEIWFIEKDKRTGASAPYSLLQFKPRYDLDIKKGYLKGRFGAIPFLANLEELNWKTAHA